MRDERTAPEGDVLQPDDDAIARPLGEIGLWPRGSRPRSSGNPITQTKPVAQRQGTPTRDAIVGQLNAIWDAPPANFVEERQRLLGELAAKEAEIQEKLAAARQPQWVAVAPATLQPVDLREVFRAQDWLVDEVTADERLQALEGIFSGNRTLVIQLANVARDILGRDVKASEVYLTWRYYDSVKPVLGGPPYQAFQAQLRQLYIACGLMRWDQPWAAPAIPKRGLSARITISPEEMQAAALAQELRARGKSPVDGSRLENRPLAYTQNQVGVPPAVEFEQTDVDVMMDAIQRGEVPQEARQSEQQFVAWSKTFIRANYQQRRQREAARAEELRQAVLQRMMTIDRELTPDVLERLRQEVAAVNSLPWQGGSAGRLVESKKPEPPAVCLEPKRGYFDA